MEHPNQTRAKLVTSLGALLRQAALPHVVQHPAAPRRGQNGRYIRGHSLSRTALRIVNSDECLGFSISTFRQV